MRCRAERSGFVGIVVVVAAALSSFAQADAPSDAPSGKTIVVDVSGEIDLGLAPFVERVLADAGQGDTVVFEINTFGGRVDAAVQIRDAILRTHARTIAFVNKRAISAGALIALACDS